MVGHGEREDGVDIVPGGAPHHTYCASGLCPFGFFGSCDTPLREEGARRVDARTFDWLRAGGDRCRKR
jgi:hypothetical protein